MINIDILGKLLSATGLTVIAARPTVGHEELAEHFSGKQIITANMYRTVDARKEHRPVISDIILDDDIKVLADTIIVIFKPSYYDSDFLEDICYAQIIKENGQEVFKEVELW